MGGIYNTILACASLASSYLVVEHAGCVRFILQLHSGNKFSGSRPPAISRQTKPGHWKTWWPEHVHCLRELFYLAQQPLGERSSSRFPCCVLPSTSAWLLSFCELPRPIFQPVILLPGFAWSLVEMIKVSQKQKQFRKRTHHNGQDSASEDEDDRRLAVEEVKYLQKQRERKSGVVAVPVVPLVGALVKVNDKVDGGEGEKEELVLQDTFAQETAVTVEDPNMLKYIEQELAKKRGRELGIKADEAKPVEDDLYVIPEHLKVRRRNAEESSTQWTTGIAEVQLPMEFKLKNIEETEAAKKQLQDKRPFVGRGRSQSCIPASYSADYFQRGREYAEKLRRDHPELYKDREAQDSGRISGETSAEGNVGNRRQAATDEIMLERFRKRERSRLMRR